MHNVQDYNVLYINDVRLVRWGLAFFSHVQQWNLKLPKQILRNCSIAAVINPGFCQSSFFLFIKQSFW